MCLFFIITLTSHVFWMYAAMTLDQPGGDVLLRPWK